MAFQMSDEEFDATLGKAIDSICAASVASLVVPSKWVVSSRRLSSPLKLVEVTSTKLGENLKRENSGARGLLEEGWSGVLVNVLGFVDGV